MNCFQNSFLNKILKNRVPHFKNKWTHMVLDIHESLIFHDKPQKKAKYDFSIP